MRIHHLNCISTCPLGGRLMDGRSDGILERGSLTCHCLLVETADSLVLVDTGMGLRDVADPQGLALAHGDHRGADVAAVAHGTGGAHHQ